MQLENYKVVFGLIGKELTHSFSKKYFNKKFKIEGKLDQYYELFPIPKASDLQELFIKYPNLKGLNVTIPYKQEVLPYLDEIDTVVKQIGAVNTILNKGGKLYGFNTDVIGFENALITFLNGKVIEKCYVLGTGGASKAIEFVLNAHNISPVFVSRSAGENKITYEELSDDFDDTKVNLFINTTPVGTIGVTPHLLPLCYDKFSAKTFLFDLVYNPQVTPFMEEGLKHFSHVTNGHKMLIGQAEASYKIWTNYNH